MTTSAAVISRSDKTSALPPRLSFHFDVVAQRGGDFARRLSGHNRVSDARGHPVTTTIFDIFNLLSAVNLK
jgi:hypothetical protein